MTRPPRTVLIALSVALGLFLSAYIGTARTAVGAQASQTVPPGSTRLALVGGTLIDGTMAAPTRNAVVLINGGRIERVGTVNSLPVPQGYTVISTEGQTVLPGLTDMHVHLLGREIEDAGAFGER